VATAQAAAIVDRVRQAEQLVEVEVVVVPQASGRRWMEIRLSTLRSDAAADGSVRTQADGWGDSSDAHALER
jgi:hypothetical protein